MKFVNLTNRVITIANQDGSTRLIIAPSGVMVSVNTKTIRHATYFSANAEVECVRYEYTDVHGLPDKDGESLFIVSYAVLQALKGMRDDVVAPDSSPGSVIKDAHGKVVGVQQFRKL